MENLERKDILNVKENTKKQSVFDHSEEVLNILYNTYIKSQFHKK
ncbi:MAG: hypothetical protein Q4Q31_03910 [Bacillota bacterium]|nr:hypothetical protein [Bacillota bacterium]